MVRLASYTEADEAAYWRRRFEEMPDAELVRWMAGVARLKLRDKMERQGVKRGSTQEARP